MQLRNDFAKHISELHNPIDRPYTASIDKSLLENIEDVERNHPTFCVTAI